MSDYTGYTIANAENVVDADRNEGDQLYNCSDCSVDMSFGSGFCDGRAEYGTDMICNGIVDTKQKWDAPETASMRPVFSAAILGM